jgi:hypothetical protein
MIDHRKVVALTTVNTPFTKYITSTDGYQVTDTVTSYTKSVYLVGYTPPEPAEPLEVADGQGSNWLGTNVYEVGKTVEGKTAAFTGGVNPVTYRYRFQFKATGSDTWVSDPWVTTTNSKNTVTYTLTETGDVKLQSQARDSSDPAVQLNSTTGVKNVTAPGPITIVTAPVVSGSAFVGETLYSTIATFTGGSAPVTAKTMWTTSTESNSGFTWIKTSPNLLLSSDLNGKYIRSQTEIEDSLGNKKWANSTTIGPISYYTIGNISITNLTQGPTIISNGSVETLDADTTYTYTYSYSGNLPASKAMWDVNVRSGGVTITSRNSTMFELKVPAGTSLSTLSVSVASTWANDTPPGTVWNIAGSLPLTFGTLTIDPSGDRVAIDETGIIYTPISTGNIPLTWSNNPATPADSNVTWSCDNAGYQYATSPVYIGLYNNGNARINANPAYAVPNTNYIIRCTLAQPGVDTVTETFNLFFRYPVPGPALTNGGMVFWAIGGYAYAIDINNHWRDQDFNPNVYMTSATGTSYTFRFPAGAEVKFWMNGQQQRCEDIVYASSTTMLEDEGREVRNVNYEDIGSTNTVYGAITIQLQPGEEYIRFKNVYGNGRIWFNGQIGDRQGTINGNPMIYEQSISTRAQNWIDENPDQWDNIIDESVKHNKSQEAE